MRAPTLAAFILCLGLPAAALAQTNVDVNDAATAVEDANIGEQGKPATPAAASDAAVDEELKAAEEAKRSAERQLQGKPAASGSSLPVQGTTIPK